VYTIEGSVMMTMDKTGIRIKYLRENSRFCGNFLNNH